MPTSMAGLAHMAHMARLVRAAVPRVHPGGVPVIAGMGGTTLAARAVLRAVGLRRSAAFVGRAGLLAAAGSALFFRVPDRVPPTDPRLIVAPADGIVAQITRAAPPAETGVGDAGRTRVSIFLSLLDVHVQFAPVAGTVRAAHYHPGAFFSADLDKASEANERHSLVIVPSASAAATSDDGVLVVTQIAGLLARRIVCDAAAGDEVRTGEVYGLIRFGSRLDVYLPRGAEPEVRLGQRAVGGETVLARLAGMGDG